jgi:hypothetical protein
MRFIFTFEMEGDVNDGQDRTRREDILGSRFYRLTQPGEQEKHPYLPFWTAVLWVGRPYLSVWTEFPLLTVQAVWMMTFQILVR